MYSGIPVYLTPPEYQFGVVSSANTKALDFNAWARTMRHATTIGSLGRVLDVIVEVRVKDATFFKAYLPGIGYYYLDFPWGHKCFGKSSTECNTLREFRWGDFSKVIVTPNKGYWGYDETPEGGIEALDAALEESYWFTELDIRLSKDKLLMLLADEGLNRMTDLPPTPDECGAASIRNLNAYSDNTDVPLRNPNNPTDPNFGIYPVYPALSSGHLKDRFGEVNLNDEIDDLEAALNFIKANRIFIILIYRKKTHWITWLLLISVLNRPKI